MAVGVSVLLGGFALLTTVYMVVDASLVAEEYRSEERRVGKEC